MPRTRSPRKGSWQYWPRARAKREYPRIRSWAQTKDNIPLGFAGYKVGMTHIISNDNRPNSLTKGMDISVPVTIIECPPIKIIGYTTYKNTHYGLKQTSRVLTQNPDKELTRKIILPKQNKQKEIKIDEFDDLRILIQTQPKLTTIGKKKPEIFEIAIGGTKEQKLQKAKELLGKELKIDEIFKEGEQVDIHAITKGQGTQGPTKRFHLAIRHHKSEKTKRGPGSLGPWGGPAMWQVAHAAKTGYNQRLMYSNWLLKIIHNSQDVNPKSGFKHYGIVKNTCVLIRGSVPGSNKRMITLTKAKRPNKQLPKQPLTIKLISK